jgi:hypothetical protein
VMPGVVLRFDGHSEGLAVAVVRHRRIGGAACRRFLAFFSRSASVGDAAARLGGTERRRRPW